MHRLAKFLPLAALLPLMACDPTPATVRGPSSEPVTWVESSRLFLAEGQARLAQPLLPSVDDPSRPQEAVPEPAALVAAFAAVAGPGIEVASIPAAPAAESPQPPIAIALILDLARFEPMLLTQPDGTDGVTALTKGNATVVLGSAFVAEFSPLQPLGLLQVDGQLINELQPHGYTRVLGFADDGIGVVGRSAYHRGLFSSALQVGPGIIEQGKLDISERELKLPEYFRTFLANCGPSLLVGASTRPVHLRVLGDRLLAFADQRNLACDEAVNLSGDREVLLALRNADEAIVLGNPRVKKTALIGFGYRPLSPAGDAPIVRGP